MCAAITFILIILLIASIAFLPLALMAYDDMKDDIKRGLDDPE